MRTPLLLLPILGILGLVACAEPSVIEVSAKASAEVDRKSDQIRFEIDVEVSESALSSEPLDADDDEYFYDTPETWAEFSLDARTKGFLRIKETIAHAHFETLRGEHLTEDRHFVVDRDGVLANLGTLGLDWRCSEQVCSDTIVLVVDFDDEKAKVDLELQGTLVIDYIDGLGSTPGASIQITPID